MLGCTSVNWKTERCELLYRTKSVANAVETSSKAKAITIWRSAAVVSAA